MNATLDPRSLILIAFLGGQAAAGEPNLDQIRIDTFPLDPPAWHSARGVAPASVRGILPVPGLRSGAARTDPSADTAQLEYALLSHGSDAGFQFDRGTVRWLYRPDWATADSGPGSPAVMLEIRTRESRPRGFRWQVDAKGSRLDWIEFVGDDERLLTSGSVAWARDRWVVLTATFSPEGSILYTNGVVARTTNGFSRMPSLAHPPTDQPLRLCVGSDEGGTRPARGAVDGLELFNYPLSPLLVQADLSDGIWAESTADPPSLKLSWRISPELELAVRRRTAGETDWKIVATNLNSWSWTDTQVTPGVRYEYVLDRVERSRPTPERYLPAAIEAPAVHDPGRVLVLVDRTLASDLTTELEQLREDLRAEGWQPIIREAPRHIPAPWSRNVSLVEQVRRIVADEYDRAPGTLRALLLLGHIPIPHSGGYRPDGHHTRPFPADGYYGDTVRGTNDWTDTVFFPASPDIRTGHGKVPNNIGDGMFDQRLYPSRVEVPVGRVDFANLPALTDAAPGRGRRASEVELLRRYLDKAHRFRRGRLSFPHRMSFYHPPPVLPTPLNAVRLLLRDGHAWFGGNPAFIENLDPMREGRTRGYLVASLAGFGSPTGVGHTLERRWRTADLALAEQEPSVGLYWVDGSYLGDWNVAIQPVKDVFQRALLAPPNSGLAAVWSRLIHGKVLLQGIGLGDTLGQAFWYKLSACPLRDGSENLIGHIHISLLGDPTLRLLRIEPVTGLRGRVVRDRGFMNWNRAADPATAYHVYRAPDEEEGALVRLTDEPVTAAHFVDPEPLSGPTRYWVRPVRLTVTGCGSFHNLGPGESVTIP